MVFMLNCMSNIDVLWSFLLSSLIEIWLWGVQASITTVYLVGGYLVIIQKGAFPFSKSCV